MSLSETPIADLSRVTDTGGGEFRWDVPEGWRQGRGAFGGLVICAGIRTLDQTVDSPELALRAVNATLCGPVTTGAAQIAVRELRRGSNTHAVSCEMIQGDEVRAQITAFYGVQRVDDGDWQTMQPPEMPDWREIDPAPVEPPLGPEFAQHMEFRPTGLLPFAGADERRASGWIRPKVAPELTGPAYIALLADTFWPAFYSTQEMPRPAATVMFMMEFFDDLVPGDNAPVFFRSHSPAARGGYTMEQRELWTPDGRLLALNQQSVCMIR